MARLTSSLTLFSPLFLLIFLLSTPSPVLASPDATIQISNTTIDSSNPNVIIQISNVTMITTTLVHSATITITPSSSLIPSTTKGSNSTITSTKTRSYVASASITVGDVLGGSPSYSSPNFASLLVVAIAGLLGSVFFSGLAL